MIVTIALLILVTIFLFYVLHVQNHSAEKFESSPNVVIFKGAGGLAHMLSDVNQVIHSCLKNKKELVIDTKTHNAFDGDFFNYFYIVPCDINISSTYPLQWTWKNIPSEQIEKNGIHWVRRGTYEMQINEKKYKLDTQISRKSKVNVVSHLNDVTCEKNYVRLNGKLIYRLNADTGEFSGNAIGVHYRNTDYKNDYDEMLNTVNKKIDETGIHRVYLATDDYYAYDKFNRDINGVVMRKTFPKMLQKHEKNIHYSNKDKSKVVYDCLLDVYCLTKCKHFIPSKKSELSQLIIRYREDPDNSIFSFK